MKKLNYVWFCTDQQRYDTIGALGNPNISTPNLDRLVREGTAFLRAYTQSPMCTPSRSSFLTGRYPRSARGSINGNLVFSRDETLVTKLFADEGYTCGLVGKLHLTSVYKRMEARTDDGYSYFQWSHHPFDSWEEGLNDYQTWLKEKGVDWRKAYGAPFHDGVLPAPQPLPEKIRGIAAEYHQTTWCVEKAIEFIEQSKDGPWCISINPFDPHPPFDPPEEYKAKIDAAKLPLPAWKEGELAGKPEFQTDCYLHGSQRGLVRPACEMNDDEKREVIRDYYAEVMLIDDQLGRLMDYLDHTGQRENTVIIFMSDHGEMLGDHGQYWKGGLFYEQLVHVPLILSCPGTIQQGLRSDALVELVDLSPTLLELSGLPVPAYMQGKSLAGILKGTADPSYHKDCVYTEYYYSAGRPHQVCATMYYDGRYKVVVHHNGEIGELYDHAVDPEEFHNLWDEPDSQQLRAEMVLKCFDHTILCNIDRVLGNTGMY